MSEKPKLLTVKFPLLMLAEFATAVELNGERSVSTAVHSFVRQTINEAKKAHDAKKFAEICQKKEAEITERGKKKAAERTRGARKTGKQVNLKPRKGTRRTGSE